MKNADLVELVLDSPEALAEEIGGAPLPTVADSLKLVTAAAVPGGTPMVGISIDTPEGRVCYTLPVLALLEAVHSMGRQHARSL